MECCTEPSRCLSGISGCFVSAPCPSGAWFCKQGVAGHLPSGSILVRLPNGGSLCLVAHGVFVVGVLRPVSVGIPSLRKTARGDTWWPRRKAKTCQKGCPMGASTSVVQSSSTQPLLWPHTRRLRWQAAPWASTRHRRPPLHNWSSGCPTHFGMFHVVAMGSICALQQLKIDRRRREGGKQGRCAMPMPVSTLTRSHRSGTQIQEGSFRSLDLSSSTVSFVIYHETSIT